MKKAIIIDKRCIDLQFLDKNLIHICMGFNTIAGCWCILVLAVVMASWLLSEVVHYCTGSNWTKERSVLQNIVYHHIAGVRHWGVSVMQGSTVSIVSLWLAIVFTCLFTTFFPEEKHNNISVRELIRNSNISLFSSTPVSTKGWYYLLQK